MKSQEKNNESHLKNLAQSHDSSAFRISRYSKRPLTGSAWKQQQNSIGNSPEKPEVIKISNILGKEEIYKDLIYS